MTQSPLMSTGTGGSSSDNHRQVKPVVRSGIPGETGISAYSLNPGTDHGDIPRVGIPLYMCAGYGILRGRPV